MSDLNHKTDATIFKFALFGIRGSGKTCILSALALPRYSNPKGYTCTWIENLSEVKSSIGSSDKNIIENSFIEGSNWLRKAKSTIKNGDIPAPNANRDVMRFLFEFGSKENGRISVELIDYSGELLLASRNELTKKLWDIMQNCDGLLVLAEVPQPGLKSGEQAESLNNLSEAFASLIKERDSKSKQEWPIALLFNKWDRKLNIASNENPGREAIDNFLAEVPEPPHKSLVNKVSNFIGDENLMCFPVSAFGSHVVRQDGSEVPKFDGQMLKTINLEDGFIWIAERSKILNVKMLKNASEKASWWFPHQMVLGRTPAADAFQRSAIKNLICGISVFSGISSTWNLMKKLPDKSEENKQANNILKLFALKAGSQVLVGFLIFVLFIQMFEIWMDGIVVREIKVRRENPSTDEKVLEKDEKWLTDYYASTNYRHFLSKIFVLTKNQSKTMAIESAKKRDESAYRKIENAKEVTDKVILAQDYIKAFPTGGYIETVQVIVTKAETQKNQNLNMSYLENLKLTITLFPDDLNITTNSVQDLKNLLEKINSLPHPDYLLEEHKKEQGELRKLVEAKQIKILNIIARMELEKFNQEYNDLMNKENIMDAAKLLMSHKENDVDKLKDDFRSKCPDIIKKNVISNLKLDNFIQARRKLKDVGDLNVNILLSAEQIMALKNLEKEIDNGEDKYFYDQVIKYKNKDRIDNYLTTAPLKTMKKDVENYKTYLDKRTGEVEVTIECRRIEWGEKFYGNVYSYRNDIEVIVNGRHIIAANKISSKPNTSSAGIGSNKIKLYLEKNIDVKIIVTTSYGALWDSKMDGGKGEWSGKYTELQNSKTLDLIPQDNSFKNRATIVLSGVDPEPSLPPWKED